MPSPFPGMDPYLENPSLWPDVHHECIGVAREFLASALRPKYFVQIDERLFIEDDLDRTKSITIPDLRIREVSPNVMLRTQTCSDMVIEPGIEINTVFRVGVHESRLMILDRQEKRAVTVIEILSPANKTKGSTSYGNYNQKKQEILSSETNFVEIDLLRAGVPLVSDPHFESFDYFAQVWRWTGERHRRWVWPMRLIEPLKPIPIPVRLGDADGVLDLQAVLNTAYERAGYELRVDYEKETVPPLVPEAAEWARTQIESAAMQR